MGEPTMPDGTTSAARETRSGASSASRRRMPAPYDTPMAAGAWSSAASMTSSPPPLTEALVATGHADPGAETRLADRVW